MPASPRGFVPRAKFNVEPMDGIVIYDFTIVEAPDGKYRVYAPSGKYGSETASLSPEFRNKIISTALLQLDEDLHDQKNHKAA